MADRTGSVGCLPNDEETKARASERIGIAVECISQGMPQSEIVKLLCTKHDTSWRNAYRDVAKARKRLGKACAKRGTDEAIGEAIAKAEAHYVRCVKSGDNAAGLATLKHLAQLTGALQMADVLVQQQVNALQINGASGEVLAQMQAMSTEQLGAFVLERVERLQITAKAEDN